MHTLPCPRRSLVAALATLLICSAISSVAHARVTPVAGDEFWSSGFEMNGTDGTVNTVVQDGTDIIIGGSFTMVDEVPAQNVARWDGSSWSAMGAGFDDEVRDLIVWNGDLYAGGFFQFSGANPARTVARWDGTAWIEVGGGTDGSVECFTIFGTDLIVGGDFTQLDLDGPGVFAESVAAWNGSSWQDLNSGFQQIDFGYVNALEVFAGELYAGGFFIGASATFDEVGHLARYSGFDWEIVGGGLLQDSDAYSAEVLDLEVFDQRLFVTGYFNGTGDFQFADGIASWTGSQWINSGVLSGLGAASRMAVHGTDLYVVDGCSVLYRMTQTGQQFFEMSTRFFGASCIHDLISTGSDLVIAGSFSFLDLYAIRGIARYDGAQVTSFSGNQGLAPSTFSNTPAREAVVWDGKVVMGGGFWGAADVRGTRGLAAWDGSQWSSLGLGITGSTSDVILAMTVYQGDLIVGGTFTQVGPVNANRVARWDGVQWSPLGTGSVSTVTALFVWNNELYAHMDPAAGNGSITRWNGSSWDIIGQDTLGGDAVKMVEYGGQLIVGGQMNSIAGVAVNHLAAFDGTTWSSFAGGVSGGTFTKIDDMVVIGTTLYVTGDFTAAGGVPANYIAAFDGSTWSAVGGGLSARGLDVDNFGGDLVVAGTFTSVDNGAVPAAHVARYRMGTWEALGSGVDDAAYVALEYGGKLHLGGSFTQAGGQVSRGFAIYDTNPATATDPLTSTFAMLPAAPNPFGESTSVAYSLGSSSSATAVVHDLRGRLVRRVALGSIDPGAHTFTWDGRDQHGQTVASGTYFLVIRAGAQLMRSKVTFVR